MVSIVFASRGTRALHIYHLHFDLQTVLTVELEYVMSEKVQHFSVAKLQEKHTHMFYAWVLLPLKFLILHEAIQ